MCPAAEDRDTEERVSTGKPVTGEPVSAEALAQHRAQVRLLPITELLRRLIVSARRRGASAELAQDLAQTALARLWSWKGGERWDPVGDPDAYLFLLDAMRQARKMEAKKTKRRRTDLDTGLVEESPPSSDRGPARLAEERQRAERGRDELLRRVASSPLTRQVAELCIREGALKPAQVAVRLGVDVSRIYECQRRIRDAVDDIEAERAQAEAADEGEGEGG